MLLKQIAKTGSAVLLSSVIATYTWAGQAVDEVISDKEFQELMISVGAPADQAEEMTFKPTGNPEKDARYQLMWDAFKVNLSMLFTTQKALIAKMQAGEINQDEFSTKLKEAQKPGRILLDQLWELYEEDDKSSDIAFETLVFLSEHDSDEKDRVANEVKTTYLHDARVSGLVHKRATSHFSKAEQTELEKVVRDSKSPAVRATAVVTIVQHLNEVRKQFKEMELFGTTVDDVIFSQFSQGLKNMMQNGGVNPYGEGKTLTREMFDTNPELIKAKNEHPLQDWAGISIAEITATIQKLMKQAEPWGNEDVYFPSVEPQGGVDLSRKVKVAKLMEKVQQELDNDPVGKPMGEFLLSDYDGKEVSLDSLQGKVLLVDFWATWCGPCKAAMPHNKKLLKHYEGRPFELVTISVDADVEDAIEYMDENDYGFRVLWHTEPGSELLRKWKVDAYPTYFVIDDLGILRSIPKDRGQAMDDFIERIVTEAEGRNRSKG